MSTGKSRRYVSKSILFPKPMLEKLAILAEDLGYTRWNRDPDGEDTADISKIVKRTAEFALAHTAEFKLWSAGAVMRWKPGTAIVEREGNEPINLVVADE